ncbi:hypothetical protein [Streptomyces sp. NPDC058657]|uniref:hypothetical protein n=1 Tax=unclassified Streptomyces TaxID=2593676 RepID=UPI003648B833
MKFTLLHTAAAHLVLGLFTGTLLHLTTGGQVGPYTVALVSLVLSPVITTTAVRLGRALETRQLNDAYNQPAHGEQR